jgi:hypothetical protein
MKFARYSLKHKHFLSTDKFYFTRSAFQQNLYFSQRTLVSIKKVFINKQSDRIKRFVEVQRRLAIFKEEILNFELTQLLELTTMRSPLNRQFRNFNCD